MTDPDAIAARIDACQARLRAAGADVLVLFPGTNLAYCSGFSTDPEERHLHLFVPAEGDPAFVVPELYEAQVRASSPVADVRTWADDEDPVVEIEAAVADLGVDRAGRVLVDDRMWALFIQDLRRVLPDAEFGLASEVLEDLRICKDEAELDAMRRAAAVADRVSREVRKLGADAVGMTEREVAREIERRMAEAGGAEPSFETIVGSGPNGAMPHHTHGDRQIEAGDPVVLDFGTRVDGYPSDQTRTVVFAGDPPEGFRAVHEVVREAQQTAVEAVEPGVAAETIDRAAREVIEAAGYGDQFVHRTGHGVGLDVHEPPYVVGGNDRELEPGMVFSVEPGVYVDGAFGVRVEDLVVVTGDGCERLNDSPRTWKPL